MRRDYKELYKQYFSKNRFPGDWETIQCDLLFDQPDDETRDIFQYIYNDGDYFYDEDSNNYIFRGYIAITDKEIEAVCIKYANYEWWAKIVASIYDWANMIKSNDIFRSDSDLKDPEICDNVERSNEILDNFKDMSPNIYLDVFSYYRSYVEPKKRLKNITDHSTKIMVAISAPPKHNKTLLDVVNNLSDFNDRRITESLRIILKSINAWLYDEQCIWESEIINEVPQDKIGVYFLKKVTNLLDEFKEYLPQSYYDWDMTNYNNKIAYHCFAIESYLYAVSKALTRYDIKDTENIKAIHKLAWFYFIAPEDDHEVLPASLPIPMAKDKKLREFLDEVTEYVNSRQGDHKFNKHDFYYGKFDEWIKLNIQKIKDKFDTISEKNYSKHLFNVVHNLRNEFIDYWPCSYDEFTASQDGEHWYYIEALFRYIGSIGEIRYLYGLKDDRFTTMVSDMTRYFANEEDTTEGDEPEENLRLLENYNPWAPLDTHVDTPDMVESSSSSDNNDNYILASNPQAFKTALKNCIKNTIGKQAAIYIYAVVTDGRLHKIKTPDLQAELGFGGTVSAFNTAYRKIVAAPQAYNTEIEGARSAIQRELEKL